jgi:aryl-phospho-beta-D-glucosidase BglC (GH1 family)
MPLRRLPSPAFPAGVAFLALACAAAHPPYAPEPALAAARTGVPAVENPFLHAVGRDLVDGAGRKVVLRGLCFGNQVWGDPALPPRRHHGEADYAYLRSLGVNAIRFYLNDRLFEDPGAPGAYQAEAWTWLDDNFAWARRHGIYLVLNLHVPPGGFQSNGGGGALWYVQENRERFVALWRAVAARYREEPALAGYDLLNEPVVASDPAEWEHLARRTAAAVREVDPRHALFVERTNAVIGTGGSPDWNEDRNGELNFFLLDDTNVVYEFHFYKPMAFTHQGAAWVPALRGVKTRYPGPFKDWDGAVKTGDRAYVERALAPYFAFGERHQVPLFLGEFGVIRAGYEQGRNGTGWVADVIDVALAHGVSLTYHAFHEEAFGLYGTDGGVPPALRNEPLAELLARKFR